ncbi:phospholipase C [Gonium pectorale]|uniref:Phosphoinositide phospholipase C n=1 Tax=Gonium pectorale TaxID=33097 RepID=A0A150GQV3_GONPE|nr:phospholipase C [Gonium pectorale]|eukprot:KXZ52118.1 phospholipase C [Gonium pectorale]
MSQPLPCYFISSGHNSYLTRNQLFSASGTATIVKASLDILTLTAASSPAAPWYRPQSLLAGCRVIELDTFNGPVCKHGGTLTSSVGVQPADLASVDHTPKEPDAAAAAGGEPRRGTVEKAVTKVKQRVRRMSNEVVPECAAAAAAAASAAAAAAAARQVDAAPRPPDAPAVGSLQELYRYTSRHLLRVYPAIWRVRSDSFNPMKAWVRGVSMAALNWQVWDKHLRTNQGKFLDNGGCGYVLKPEWMRAPGPSLPARQPRRLIVHVFSAFRHQGRNMGVFKDDLFVRIRLLGMPSDCAKAVTHTVNNSGRLRVDKDFYFDVRFPEMAVLSIELMDEDAREHIRLLGMPSDCAKAVTHTVNNSGRLRVDKDFYFDVRFPEMAVLSIELMDEDALGNHADADTLGYYSLPLASLAEGDFKLNLRSPKSGEPLPLERTWVKVGLRWQAAAQDTPAP